MTVPLGTCRSLRPHFKTSPTRAGFALIERPALARVGLDFPTPQNTELILDRLLARLLPSLWSAAIDGRFPFWVDRTLGTTPSSPGSSQKTITARERKAVMNLRTPNMAKVEFGGKAGP